MPNYLLAYHGGGMPALPEEQASVMAAWGQWYQGLGEAVVDGPIAPHASLPILRPASPPPTPHS